MKKIKNTNELAKAMAEQVTNSDIIAAEQLAAISATITKCRIDRKMNQAEFAEHIGVSQGMVSKWESQDYNFTIESLAKICDKLKLELNIEMKSQQAYNQNIKKSMKKWNHENILVYAGGVA